MKEEWRDIKGYEGYYQVSNMGRVCALPRQVYDKNGRIKRLRFRILATKLSSGAYPRAGLSKDNIVNICMVHTLVANAFLPAPSSSSYVIDHINRRRDDNRAENLRWVSVSENYANSEYARLQSSRFRGVTLDKKCERWVAQIGFNRSIHRLGRFKSEIDAARAYDAFCIEHKLDRVLNHA